jgi:hypothetical protein
MAGPDLMLEEVADSLDIELDELHPRLPNGHESAT